MQLPQEPQKDSAMFDIPMILREEEEEEEEEEEILPLYLAEPAATFSGYFSGVPN